MAPLRACGGIDAGIGRRSAGDPAHRQRAQGAAVDELAGAQQRLWRGGAAGVGVAGAEPAAHEPGARSQRGIGLRPGRAGRALLRPVRSSARDRIVAVDVGAGPRLGQRARQYGRPWHGLHAQWRSSGQPVRAGSGAAERRRDAHRHGGDDQRQVLAGLQARLRAERRRPVHAVQFRRGHQDGPVADAGARMLHAGLADTRSATATSSCCSSGCGR